MGRHERIERRQVLIPYTPRPQFLPYHNRTERWAWIVAHRRFGKTVGCINELVKGALVCTKPDPRFAYIAPLYTQAKDVAWGYLKHFTAGIPGVTAHESELRVDLPNGGRVRLYGAENYDRMRGIYLDGAILDEYGDMDPRVWPEVIRPALSDRQG
jgi:phage terminase large subunit